MKNLHRHVLATVLRILAKYGTMMQIDYLYNTSR